MLNRYITYQKGPVVLNLEDIRHYRDLIVENMRD